MERTELESGMEIVVEVTRVDMEEKDRNWEREVMMRCKIHGLLRRLLGRKGERGDGEISFLVMIENGQHRVDLGREKEGEREVKLWDRRRGAGGDDWSSSRWILSSVALLHISSNSCAPALTRAIPHAPWFTARSRSLVVPAFSFPVNQSSRNVSGNVDVQRREHHPFRTIPSLVHRKGMPSGATRLSSVSPSKSQRIGSLTAGGGAWIT